ncbi:MAG: N-6 DNA methylase [Methanobacterium sp.]
MQTAPEEVIELVKNFKRNIKAYKNRNYKEEQLKQEFLNPFFKALGWDVDNEQGAAPQYRDVIFEDSIKVGGGTKAPDYCFTLAGVRKFFVEAKKPSVDIKIGIQPSYQLRRYAWSAKLPVSILTDFEELSVYEARSRPKKNENAGIGRILYYTFEDYIDKWDEIYNIFSKEAVLKGKFDKFAEGTKKKRGTHEVDDEFLSEIENWRDLLAKNIALRNEELSVDQLNYAVQQIIDRIVFLRMCEDRGIEPQEQLKLLLEHENIYEEFCKLCIKADEKYNSGLFHFKEEKGRNTPHDDLTMTLKIDDGILKTIIKSIYYPSPYEFSVISVEILGHVYEQFLGKVIRLTAGHRAKVEEKPEVKKAGGVYYTPQFIVDYIVENTVGKLCKGKTPNKVSELKILDPACGSGSFLLGAYTYLLKWHLDYYTNLNDKKRLKDKIYQGKGGEWFLTIQEKKKILLNNIYGVDIDPQAVEVTKLSLLLKVLEGENKDVIEAQQKLFRERALPDLESNIKCGNSLISSEIYDSDLTLSDEKIVKINAFDWEDEFSDIMANGGFDAVIGNPPYVDVKVLGNGIKKALSNKYSSATRRFDLYIPFVEQGLNLISNYGLLGYIMPSMFTRRDYGQGLRTTIKKLGSIQHVVDFGTNQVFKKAMNYVGIFIINKSTKQKDINILRCDKSGIPLSDLDKCLKGEEVETISNFIAPSFIFNTDDEWYFLNKIEFKLFKRLFNSFSKLSDLLMYGSEGIHSGKDQVFFVKKEESQKLNLESPPTYPLAKGKDIHRYDSISNEKLNHVVIYPYNLSNGTVCDENILKQISPNTWKYLVDSRKLLKGRAYFDKSGKKWYELWCPRDPILYMSPKIIGPEISSKGEFTLSKKYLFINNKLKSLILRENVVESIEYILGLLNSSLLTYLHRIVAPPKGGGFFEVKTKIMGSLPIRTIDFQNPDDVALHDKMVKLVEQMLQLHKNLDAAKTPNEKKMLKRQIDATDKQIDKLVYELYDLTDEEIKIVENSVKN